MIPIKDTIPSRTYPIVTISLIAVNSVLFLYEISLGPNLGEFISDYSVIPAKYFHLAVSIDFCPYSRPYFCMVAGSIS